MKTNEAKAKNDRVVAGMRLHERKCVVSVSFNAIKETETSIQDDQRSNQSIENLVPQYREPEIGNRLRRKKCFEKSKMTTSEKMAERHSNGPSREC